MSENFQVPNRAVAVTPSDTTEVFSSAIYVGTGGDVSVLTEGGDTVTFSNVPAGTTLVVRATRIRSTGTTATNIVRMW